MTGHSDPLQSMEVPTRARLAFAHASIQVIANGAHVDVLHIKGVAVHESLGSPTRPGSDADVLVRPRHVPALLTELRNHGWQHYSDFESGSPFGHAATVHHQWWGFGDIHRRFPGIGLAADEAFEQLWSGRTVTELAGVGCEVPSLAGQVCVLVLNAARSGGSQDRLAGAQTVWEDSPPELRREVTDLVADLQAEVAFAAALGELEPYRGRRDYRLWKVTSQGGTRLEEWAARVWAAPDLGAALRLAVRAVLVNTEHLALRIGHQPTRSEVVQEFVRRPYRGITEEIGRVRDRRRRRRRRTSLS